MFTLFGGAISWKASLQHVVALSCIKAEYIVVIEVVKEALWVRVMLNELNVKQQILVLHCDNHGAIHLSKNQMFHKRSKHIDIKLHFVQDILSKG